MATRFRAGNEPEHKVFYAIVSDVHEAIKLWRLAIRAGARQNPDEKGVRAVRTCCFTPYVLCCASWRQRENELKTDENDRRCSESSPCSQGAAHASNAEWMLGRFGGL